MTESEIAWIAGIFEGEGSVGIYGRGVCVYIAMTDKDIIERIHTLFPSPQGVRVRQRQSGRKPIYEWRIRQRQLVAEFLLLIMPWLGMRRRAQCQPVYEKASTEDGRITRGPHKRSRARIKNDSDGNRTHADVAYETTALTF